MVLRGPPRRNDRWLCNDCPLRAHVRHRRTGRFPRDDGLQWIPRDLAARIERGLATGGHGRHAGRRDEGVDALRSHTAFRSPGRRPFIYPLKRSGARDALRRLAVAAYAARSVLRRRLATASALIGL